MTHLKQSQNGVAVPGTQGKSPDDALILIGLGANLPSRFGSPVQTLQAALDRLGAAGVTPLKRSRFWRSRPVPVSDQPWFVNAVAAVGTALTPQALLALLHSVEAEFGRVRGERNAPRLLDLDLLAYGRLVSSESAAELPHPRMAERAFVLLPLAEIAGGWRHPASGAELAALIAALPCGQIVEPL